MYQLFIKRIFDVIVAFSLLAALFPFLLIAGLALYIANKGGVFFLQKRPGKYEQLFTIIKFKTMNDARDEKGELLPDELRITKIGALIRKLSIDELPQLLNVIKGDMSLIGPRPLLPEYLELYSENHKRRHLVRPGITGWAQVNGRNTVEWNTRLDLDVWYVDHLSAALDLKILFKTIFKVFGAKDISSPTHATMEKFTGSKIL